MIFLSMRHLKNLVSILFILLFILVVFSNSCDSQLKDGEQICNGEGRKSVTLGNLSHYKNKYLLYDVNPGEGFNLRRDVYMRVASLAKKCHDNNPKVNWTLVLPPWGPLYHWKSRTLEAQMQISWGAFFNLRSLSKYVPVLEFEDFLKEQGPEIDQLYYLQHYSEGWTNGHWEERMDLRNCTEHPVYVKLNDGNFHGWFWGYEETYAKDFHCLSIQGSSSTLKPLLLNFNQRAIMIDRAEVILHDAFGDKDYWMVRRSMRFSEKLINIANEFRMQMLNSSDKQDGTVQEKSWVLEHSRSKNAIGGPYIGVHLRRQDFLKARPNDVPSIKSAAQLIEKKMSELSLHRVFIATDGSKSEFDELKQYIPGAVQFKPSKMVHQEIKDGGVAIVDQWICAHARYFIGTHESTFSFRIQEQREILGFHQDSTFNRFCGQKQTSCKQPSRWTIVY